MAETLKVLGQSNPNANILTDLYTVPSSTQTTISSIVICNQSDTLGANFRISIAVNGGIDDPKQYLYYDLPLDINDTFIATIGISLGTTDKIRVFASSNNVSFNLFGVELN